MLQLNGVEDQQEFKFYLKNSLKVDQKRMKSIERYGTCDILKGQEIIQNFNDNLIRFATDKLFKLDLVSVGGQELLRKVSEFFISLLILQV